MKLIKLLIYLEDDFDEILIDDLCIDIEEIIEELDVVDRVVSQVVEEEDNA